jgi:phosphoribosyl 1,2-cyclic phosphodiesterase
MARNRNTKFIRIPAWCRNGTARWLQKNYSYEWYRHLRPYISEEVSSPGAILEAVPLGIEGIKITPVTVSHYTADIDPLTFKNKLYSSASFVIETESKKAILLWDADNMNEWILRPETDEQAHARDLMIGADYLFIDCLEWSVEEVQGFNTGHLSFYTVKKYASVLHPHQTLIVHMSGHEDGEGNCGYGWSDDRWESEAEKAWKSSGLEGSIRVPTIGEEFFL